MKPRDRRFLTHLTWSGSLVVVMALAIGTWAALPFVKYQLTPQQHIVLQLETTKEVPSITPIVSDQVAAIVQKRVDGLGLAGASIATAPGDRIVVDVRAPDVKVANLRTVVAERGVLEFKICPPKVRSYAGCGQVVATGAELRNAQAGFGTGGEPQVNFTTKNPVAFERLTRNYTGQWLGIFLDGRSVSVATIEGVISSSGMIHGTFTEEQVKEMATELNAGTLPVPVRIVEPT